MVLKDVFAGKGTLIDTESLTPNSLATLLKGNIQAGWFARSACMEWLMHQHAAKASRFTLRAMLAAIAVVAVSFTFLAVAFAPLGNALALLFGASILASLAGTCLAPVFLINPTALGTSWLLGAPRPQDSSVHSL
jgi:hypothetical protein